MARKRKAAANIFMEQNVMQQEPAMPEEADEFDFDDDREEEKLPRKSRSPLPPSSFLKTSEELQLEKEPIQVRETGFWIWRNVVVPPNVYIVHTRLGRKQPITIGLGLSFRYHPYTDAYLVVPAATQTIGVVANCISKEKQGINVLAYVQWQIADFSVAYRKLDFSDSMDPLGIVNAQLREQAEAAIKDKISTMSVEEVLTDKEPIIEELTSRLKTVSEGRNQGDGETDEGLGIKIVTVQLKEALVSSQRLWENLQAPFRYEKKKMARISFLTAQDAIHKRELETRQASETNQAETMVEIERIKQSKQTEAAEIRLAEGETRTSREHQANRQKVQIEEETTIIERESEQRLLRQEAEAGQQAVLAELQRKQEEAIERTRLESEANVRQKNLQVEQALQELAEEERLEVANFQATQEQITRQTALKEQESALSLAVQQQQDQLESLAQQADLSRRGQKNQVELEMEDAANRVAMALAKEKVGLERLRQEIRNLISEADLSSRLVEKLPELAAQMPKIDQLRVLQTGGEGVFDTLPAFLAQVMAIAESLGISLGGPEEVDLVPVEGVD